MAVAQPPRIDTVSPGQGPIAGGTLVRIVGAHLAASTVTLDGIPLASLSASDAEIEVQMPAHDNGYAVFAVTGGDGTAYGRFLYVPPPLRDLPPGFITTVAGIGRFSGEYGLATEAFLRQPWAVAFDPAGRLYVSDTPNNRVFRIRGGILEPFAGNGVSSGVHPAGPAPATSVSMDFPRSIAFDRAGNLIVPDSGYYLWRVTPDGMAEIIAGNGQETPMTPDGSPAKGAGAGFPTYVAVDGDGNIFFIDWAHARVRKIAPSGVLTTVAGTGVYGFSGDGGSAVQAQFRLSFNDRGGLAIDGDGNLYLLDEGNQRIRKITRATGIIETIAGPFVDSQPLNSLRALCVEPGGRLHFSNASQIFRREVDGTIVKLTSGQRGFSEDGTLLGDAKLGAVEGLTVAPSGNLVYVDDVRRVREVDRLTGAISTLAGIGPRHFGESGPAIAAAFTTQNQDLDMLPSGELLIADSARMVKVGSDGKLVRIAGSGLPVESLEGPALATAISAASASVRSDGTIDFSQGSIGAFRIDGDGVVRRVTGNNGECGFSGDAGSAIEARLCQPWDVLHDGKGNVLIADSNNNRVRSVSLATGTISTIAGSGPVNGLERYGFGSTCGDGGPATSSCVNTPYGLALDDSGGLLICENQSRIRRVDGSGNISTFAVAPCTKLSWLFGNLYSLHGDFLARTSAGGAITALTLRDLGFSGDGGPAVEARIHAQKQSHGITADAEGNLFFADGDNLRIRAIRFGAVLPPPGAKITLTSNGTALQAMVADSSDRPAAGVRVDFTVPSAGATCRLTQPFAITDATGLTTVTCVPNCTAGDYTVTARPLTGSAVATTTSRNSGRCRGRAVRH